MKKRIYFLILFLLIIPNIGCAVHYYDDKTGTEHLWGFGHMRMRVSVPDEGIQAAVHGVKIRGLGISKSPENFSLITGLYSKDTVEIIAEDTALRLEWPSNDLFDIRFGKTPPFLKNKKINQPDKKEPKE